MGNREILLIVLATIVIGFAVLTGINIADEYSQQANRDQLISQIHTLYQMALEYKKTPQEQGGGGGSFFGWEIPTRLKNTDIGKISVRIRKRKITFYATGVEKGWNSRRKVRLWVRFHNTKGITVRIKN
jgi:hypothetical protein